MCDQKGLLKESGGVGAASAGVFRQKLIQAFTDETSLLRVGQKENGPLAYIIQ
jgi:hypothetical protein